MQIEVEKKNEVAVVSVSGSLDVSVQKNLKEELQQISETQEKDIILDLSQVSFIDSSCLGAMVALAKQLRQNRGDIKLTHLNDDVRSIFQITRLDKVFEIFDDNAAAIESFYK